MRDVIVSFASKGREPYHQYLLRLIDSCIDQWKGDILIYSPDHDMNHYRGVTIHKGWPKPKGVQSFTHAEMPYQFKTAMIQLAREKGYERVIWLDSSMELKKDLTPLFDDNESGIFCFHNLGHDTWKYLSDDAYMELARDGYFGPEPEFSDLQVIKQIWGGAFGIDFTKQKAREAFDEIKAYSINGSFKDGGSTRPGFVAHRHDQAVMSVLLHHTWGTGCNMLPYGQILCPPHDKTGEYGTEPYLVCRGL